MDILRLLAKWELHGLLFLGGFLTLYFAFFESLPAPQNDWSPTLRESFQPGLLATSSVLILVAIALVVFRQWTLGVFTRGDDVDEQPEGPDPTKHPLVLGWYALPRTQKEIVVFLYEDCHKKRILLDELFTTFCAKHGNELVQNHDEMFYRLKALKTSGFLELSAIDHQVTDIVKIDTVKQALVEGNIIQSA